MVGPPDISEAPVEIEVRDASNGVNSVELSRAWRRETLDIDVSAVFAIEEPVRLGITIDHPECIRIDRSLELRRARRRRDGSDQIIEVQVQLARRTVFKGRIVDENGKPCVCTVAVFQLPNGSDRPRTSSQGGNRLESIAKTESDHGGAFEVSCRPTSDEYLIAATDNTRRTVFWRGRPHRRSPTLIGELRFHSSVMARLAGKITAGGRALDGATIRFTRDENVVLADANHESLIFSLERQEYLLAPTERLPRLHVVLQSTSSDGSFDCGPLPFGAYRWELVETRSEVFSIGGGSPIYQGSYLHPDVRLAAVGRIEVPDHALSIDLAASWLSFHLSAEGLTDDSFALQSIRVTGRGGPWQEVVVVPCNGVAECEPLMVLSGTSYDIEVLSKGWLPFRATVEALPPGETLAVTGRLREQPTDPKTKAMTLTIDVPRPAHFEIGQISATLTRADSGMKTGDEQQKMEFSIGRSEDVEHDSTVGFQTEFWRPDPGVYDLTLTFGARLSPTHRGITHAELDRNCRGLPVSKRITVPETGDLRIEALLALGGRFLLSVNDPWGLRVEGPALSFLAADGKPVDFGPLLSRFLSSDPDSMEGLKSYGIEHLEGAFGNVTIPFLPLPPGRYEVTASHPDHAPRTASFLIEAGKDTPVNVVLSPK